MNLVYKLYYKPLFGELAKASLTPDFFALSSAERKY